MAYDGQQPSVKIASPEKHCWLMDIRSGKRLSFQLMPESITENKAAIYNEIPILGRSLPLLGYQGSTSRTIALNLMFVALNKPGNGAWDTAYVRDKVRFLESKVYPHYIGGFTFPPSLLWLSIGRSIGMQCVMLSVSTTWLGPWDISEEGDQPASAFRASVDCQFQEYGLNDGESQHPHSHDQAREGENQTLGIPGDFEGEIYTEIPLVVPEGGG